MLEKKLLEEINRFKSINKNARSLYVISEQDAGAPPPVDMAGDLPPADAAAEMPNALPAPDPSLPMVDSPVENTEEIGRAHV
jgi:hypothetical protein